MSLRKCDKTEQYHYLPHFFLFKVVQKFWLFLEYISERTPSCGWGYIWNNLSPFFNIPVLKYYLSLKDSVFLSFTYIFFGKICFLWNTLFEGIHFQKYFNKIYFLSWKSEEMKFFFLQEKFICIFLEILPNIAYIVKILRKLFDI